MWSQDPPYTVIVGVLTMDWTTLATTILPFSTNTHLRKFTFRRILDRKLRSILIALKGPGNTPKSIFVGCLVPRFRNLRAIYAKLCGGQRPNQMFTSVFSGTWTPFTIWMAHHHTLIQPPFSQHGLGSTPIPQLWECENEPIKLLSSISIYDVFTFIIFPIKL